MNLISNHNHGENKATQLLGAGTDSFEASCNAMVVINCVINKLDVQRFIDKLIEIKLVANYSNKK